MSDNRLYPILLAPRVTEKTTLVGENSNQYVFHVVNDAKKSEVKGAVEMLFDVEADPHEVHNLAADPQYADVLADMRARLQRKVKDLPDLSFYPESFLVRHALAAPVTFGRRHQAEIARLVDTADLALLPFDAARPKIEAALAARDAMTRYWAAMVCSSFGKQAAGLAGAVAPLVDDEAEVVRVRALEFLGIISQRNPQPGLTRIVNTTRDPVLATEALNSVVFFRDFFGDRYPVDRTNFHPVSRGADIDDRLNYINGEPYPRKPKKANKGKTN